MASRRASDQSRRKSPIARSNRRRRQVVRQRSAKPPSPVQIRAAPPIFQFKFDRLFRISTNERFALDYGGLQISSPPHWTCRKPLIQNGLTGGDCERVR